MKMVIFHRPPFWMKDSALNMHDNMVILIYMRYVNIFLFLLPFKGVEGREHDGEKID